MDKTSAFLVVSFVASPKGLTFCLVRVYNMEFLSDLQTAVLRVWSSASGDTHNCVSQPQYYRRCGDNNKFQHGKMLLFNYMKFDQFRMPAV